MAMVDAVAVLSALFGVALGVEVLQDFYVLALGSLSEGVIVVGFIGTAVT